MSDHREDVVVRVFVAVGGEGAGLSDEIGPPSIHVEASLEAASRARQSARRRGSGLRTPRPSQPVNRELVWSDWTPVHHAPGRRPDDGADPSMGIDIRDGGIHVALPPGMTRAGSSELVHVALGHLRAQEVTRGTAHLPRRFDEETGCRVPPRRAGHDLASDFRDGSIVTDPCVLDPAEPPRTSFRLVVSARSAALEGSRP